MATTNSFSQHSTLYEYLAASLPYDRTFNIHHFATYPAKCDPLFPPAPGARPERTFLESHFLALSAPSSDSSSTTLLFAIEILIYSTRRQVALFVSKADSTGCLASLNLPKNTNISSPIRSVSSGLLSWLVNGKLKQDHQCGRRRKMIISLFARAQGQYLFPRSVENKGKHVLDDRQLIKWWCKTLDPVVRSSDVQEDAKAYLIVPGFDRQETAIFFPASWRNDPVESRKWYHGHPLEYLARNVNVPPRCLIPRFPDDPKARYLDELDDEIPNVADSHANVERSPSKNTKGRTGMWRSVKTLAQFWEMMAFRQECSAGRMVGFIWLLFSPPMADIENVSMLGDEFDDDEDGTLSVLSRSRSPSARVISRGSQSVISSDGRFDDQPQPDAREGSPRKKSKVPKRLSGPVVARLPRIKMTSSHSSSASTMSANCPSWAISKAEAGQNVIDNIQYKRIHDLLLKLDFSNNQAASQSTKKWLEEAKAITRSSTSFTIPVKGKFGNDKEAADRKDVSGTTSNVNELSSTIIRKKRKDVPDVDLSEKPAVNVLDISLVRKKQKVK